MAKAAVPAVQSKVLKEHPRLSSRLGPYVYEIRRAEDSCTFSVSEGTRRLSLPLGWAFGEGEVGETYVLEHQGIFYESQLSYFPVLRGLDVTPGHPSSTPADLQQALGRALDAEEVHLCFGCHNTATSNAGQFDPDHLIPGITCEACHGPGAKHAAAMKAGLDADRPARMFSPAKLEPVDSVEFCGACHRTWADVVQTGAVGPETVRFQPYRLETSKCWGKGDARLTCTACHNPHVPLVRDANSYDRRCLSCHLSKSRGSPPSRIGRACPRATTGCVNCHMPKVEVPGTHTRFTDHRIQIVSSNDSRPY